MDSEEMKAFESSKAEHAPKFDPLDDFLSGGSGNTQPPLQSESPQHFGEPMKQSPSSAGKDIMDTMSFLRHESEPHFTKASGDSLLDNQFSGSPVEKEDYSLEDEVIRHKTPSPDLLPEPVKPQPPASSDPLDDFDFDSKKKPLSSYPDPFDDFLSKQAAKSSPPPLPERKQPTFEPVREPSPEPIREPSPLPVRDPTPEPVREPTPVRDPTPEPVRVPTPEPVRVPTPEPPKPKVVPPPSILESEKKVEKKEHKDPEPKPVISKPTSPPPAPPKQVSSGDSKCCGGLAVWFNPQRMHPTVEALVYWRDPKKSGIVFGSIMVVLLSLAFFSFISVVANLSLLVLVAAFGFRIYKMILQVIQKTSDGHPFKEILETDVTLPAEKVRQTSDVAVAHINATILELRRLFLVEDFVDSVKFGVGLWMLTYLGSWFNGMTLIILGVVALFTLPKVYESNKAQIDQNIDLVLGKINEITAKVKAAIPMGKKAEEKKEQ